MPILGIETSTRMGGLALLDDRGGLIGETRLERRAGHSEALLPHLDRMLREAALGPGDLTAIGVSAGPGSFTGLRVGIATAAGLAFGKELPVFPVSSLEALARPLRYSALPVCPVIHAKRNEVYACLIEWRPEGERTLLEETPLSPEALLARLLSLDAPVLFAGDGADRHRDLLRQRLGDRARFAPLAASRASAVSVAEIAFGLLEAGRTPRQRDPVPRYLKAPEAERRWAGGGRS